MKRALEHYKEKFPHIEAILIGTRRADPHGGELSPLMLMSLDILSERTSPPLPHRLPCGGASAAASV